MKQTLGSLVIVAVLLMACAGNVFGAEGHMADPGPSYFLDFIASGAGSGVAYTNTNTYWGADLTFDGVLGGHSNIYIIGTSQFSDGSVALNIAGYNVNGGDTFTFKVYSYGLAASVVDLYVIIDGGDRVLFYTNLFPGDTNLWINIPEAFGGGDDNQVLSLSSISINGGDYGDSSAINFVPGQSPVHLDSVSIVTPPVVLTSPENTSTAIDPNSSLVWEGDDASEFNVHLWDDQGGPVLVFPDLTEESLDVNGYLDWKTTYNWQVDEVIGGEVTYSSPVWTFETSDYHCQEDIAGDVNGDCVVNLADFATMAGNWLAESPKVADGS